MGNPLSSRPVWVAVSGDDGHARLPGVPNGEYYLYVVHATHAPLDPTFAGRSRIDVPHEPLEVALDELVGIVAKPADGSRVIWQQWSLDRDDFLRNTSAETARLGIARDLARRFPKSLVRVGLRKDSTRQPEVGITAILSHGGTCDARWGMIPVSQIKDPFYMEIKEAVPMAQVRLRLTHEGQDLPAIPLTLHQKRGGHYFRATNGKKERLPAGKYFVEIDSCLRPVIEWFEERSITIEADTDRDYHLPVPFKLVPIVVEPSLPYPELDTPLYIRILFDGGSSRALPAWRPEQGPIRFLVHDGPIRIDVKAQDFKPATWKGTPSQAFKPLRLFDVSRPHKITLQLQPAH